MIKYVFAFLLAPLLAVASLQVGMGKTDITPPVGSPSAGYVARQGKGMEGVKDPLLATALFIDNGEEKIALCSVDHLGFTYEMAQRVNALVHKELPDCKIFIGSSHTHSGGGGFLKIPVVGEKLAGTYNPDLVNLYVEKSAEAILQASRKTVSAKIGIGYGLAEKITTYRSSWPLDITPLLDVALIKITKEDGSPLAALFNFPIHPTTLTHQNLLFSADIVAAVRKNLPMQALFFNGAQGDINPSGSQDEIGASLAKTVLKIWKQTETSDHLDIALRTISYTFKPDKLPIEQYPTEMNLLIFNKTHAFLTVPGELSCIYDARLKAAAQEMGYAHLSIFGLTNDAHGYIITPDAWRHKTYESQLSFGGEFYGDRVYDTAKTLLSPK